MKILRVVAAVGMICPAMAAKAEPGLPLWGDGERAAMERDGWVAGRLLLTDEPVSDETATTTAAKPLDVAEPTAEEIAESEDSGNEVPEKFWTGYFDRRPEKFLVDPQGLLSPVDYRDRLGFLNYHASDSSVDLFVYVFKGDQEIPGEVREEELVERFFSEGRPAAVVYYYMGAPQRSVLYLSPSLTDAVSISEQRRAVESSVMQAFKDVDSSKQLEGFMVQMSIRIYWMERMMTGDADVAVNVPAFDRLDRPEQTGRTTTGKIEPLLERAQPLMFPVGVAGCGLLAGLAMSSWFKRRARYKFPDFEVEPRLGGSHAAGVGAVISFASAAVPPASQRDQVPDYLRRA